MMLRLGLLGLGLGAVAARSGSIAPTNPEDGGGETGGGGGSGALAISRSMRLALFDDIVTSTGSLARSSIMEA